MTLVPINAVPLVFHCGCLSLTGEECAIQRLAARVAGRPFDYPHASPCECDCHATDSHEIACDCDLCDGPQCAGCGRLVEREGWCTPCALRRAEEENAKMPTCACGHRLGFHRDPTLDPDMPCELVAGCQCVKYVQRGAVVFGCDARTDEPQHGETTEKAAPRNERRRSAMPADSASITPICDRVPCRLCGTTEHRITNLTLDSKRIEACCEVCSVSGPIAVHLGVAIHRFVRRCEVRRLTERVRDASAHIVDLSFAIECEDDLDARKKLRNTRTLEVGAFEAALTLLATMAMEGS